MDGRLLVGRAAAVDVSMGGRVAAVDVSMGGRVARRPAITVRERRQSLTVEHPVSRPV